MDEELSNEMIDDYELSVYRSVMNLELGEFKQHSDYLQQKRAISVDVLREYRVGIKYQ